MKLLDKQQNAIYFLKDRKTQEIVYGGASGGGKTALGCLWLIESCQKYPGSRWLMGRAKLKNLRETTLNTFFELATKLELMDQFDYNSQTQTIKWNNGSEILLKDLFLYPSDPEFDSLGSLEITGAFVDECNQIVYKAWQIVKSRIRFKLREFDIIPKLLGTCNPSKNWVYKEFYIKEKKGTIDKSRKFVQALPKDNHHLHPTYIQSLLNLDMNSKERLYYGNWEYDSDPSALIGRDAILDYFNPVHIERGDKKFLTIDVARMGKDKTIFRVWEGWLCTARYEIAKGKLTEVVDFAKNIQGNNGISNSNTIADEDGVGGGVVDMMRCKGFVNNSKPLLGQNYANLKSQCSIEMAKMIQGKKTGELSHSASVRDLVSEEMEQVKIKDLDKDGKLTVVPKEIIKEKLGRSPDDWDSIMMRYYFALRREGRTYETTESLEEMGINY